MDELAWMDDFAASDPTTWSGQHRRLYLALLAGTKPAQILTQLGGQEEPWDVSVLGLEKKVIPCINESTLARRRELHQQVSVVYKAASPRRRASKVRAASRALSRPARLYAQCTAQLAAQVSL